MNISLLKQYSEGVSAAEIHRRLAKDHPLHLISYDSVIRTIRRSNLHKSIKIKSSRRSLKRYDLQNKVIPMILDWYKEDNALSAPAIQYRLRQQDIHLGVTTIKNLRKHAGLLRTTTKYCHAIRDVNKQIRMDFCNEKLSNRECFSDWIFTDESTFQVDNSSKFCFAMKGDYYARLKSRNKHAAKLHCWAGMSRSGVTGLVIVDGKQRMDSMMYCEILEDALLPFISGKFAGVALLAQDNAPTHKSRYTTAWLLENHVETVTWPPESPDLNPIELLWGNMKNHIRKQNVRTLEELRHEMISYWKSITPEICSRYIDGIPRKMERVREQGGRNIFES